MTEVLDAQGRPTPASRFLLVHRALRRDLALLAGLDPAARADRWRVFRQVLDDHHRMEDERLFPALLAAEPALGPVMTVLHAQHDGLDGALAAVDRDPAALTDLRRALTAHLALEEEHLLPVMLRGPAGPPGGPVALDPELRAWLVEGVEPEVVVAVGL